MSSINNPPKVFVTGLVDAAADSHDAGLDHTVRTVRGDRMRTAEDLFGEVSAALQFPWYFGWNWDALDECLADLSWQPVAPFVLSIRSPMDILDRESEELPLFIDTLGYAQTRTGLPLGRFDGSFNVVLHAGGRQEEAADLWGALGATVTFIT